MTDDEAQEVIRLLAERRAKHEEAMSMPSVEDVAMLANASPDDVSAALAEVRNRHAEAPAHRQERRRMPFAVAIFATCAFIFGAFLLSMFYFAGSSGHRVTLTAAAQTAEGTTATPAGRARVAGSGSSTNTTVSN